MSTAAVGVAAIAGTVAIVDQTSNNNGVMEAFFYKNSIVQACDTKAIEAEKEKNKTLSTIDQFKEGVFAGIRSFFRGLVIGSIIYLAAARFSSTTNFVEEVPDFLDLVIIGPILEEVIVHGIFQSAIGVLQKLADRISPAHWKADKIWTWLSSVSFRIVATQLFFASLHLMNLGTWMATAGVIAQIALIAFDATESILYETTGSLLAPITAHITNNFMAFALV